MNGYLAAKIAAPRIVAHFESHAESRVHADGGIAAAVLPGVETIEAMIDAAFWASLRREEGYIPRISLALLSPDQSRYPMKFERPLPLNPVVLTRVAPAVERPGIHLGVWPAPHGGFNVWGMTHAIPPFCFVVEVVAAGLLVLKHRPRDYADGGRGNPAIQGDRMKIVDERASRMADCPGLLTTMIGFDTHLENGPLNILVQLSLSIRKHGRGGILLVVPARTEQWRESIVHPVPYAVDPPYAELADLAISPDAQAADRDWLDDVDRAVDAIAGLTAVDGATIITDRYEVLAFGAKIGRRKGGIPVEEVVVMEPIEGYSPVRLQPSQVGGTRHLSSAQFVRDQPDAMALVASQDGRFTIFAWSPCDMAVRAHRVEVLLL